MAFDERKVERDHLGQFTEKRGTVSADQRQRLAALAAVQANGSSSDGAVDWSQVDAWVDDIANRGPLSAGVVNRQRRQALAEWDAWARARGEETGDAAYEEFGAGLAMAPVMLMGRRFDPASPEDPRGALSRWIATGDVDPGLHAEAAELIGKKRSSAEDRERWRLSLQLAPSVAAWRGSLTAAAVMSGRAGAWGMDDDRDATVLADL